MYGTFCCEDRWVFYGILYPVQKGYGMRNFKKKPVLPDLVKYYMIVSLKESGWVVHRPISRGLPTNWEWTRWLSARWEMMNGGKGYSGN